MMLCNAESWQFNQLELCERSPEGRDAIRSQMMELVKYGYVIKYPQIRDEKGQWGSILYDVFDAPEIEEPLTDEQVELAFSKKYSMDDFQKIHPKADFPISGDPTLISYSYLSDRESMKKENNPYGCIGPDGPAPLDSDKAKEGLKEKASEAGPTPPPPKTKTSQSRPTPALPDQNPPGSASPPIPPDRPRNDSKAPPRAKRGSTHTNAHVGDEMPTQAKYESRGEKVERAPHVHTTDAEHQRLKDELGDEALDECYTMLSEWKEDTPRSRWKKCDNRSIRRWVIAAREERMKRQKGHPSTRLTAAQEADQYKCKGEERYDSFAK